MPEYIELPLEYGASEIRVSTVAVENGLMVAAIPAELWPAEVGDHDCDGVPDLMVKFDRSKVQELVGVGDNVELAVIGKWKEVPFRGSDVIRVIEPWEKQPGPGEKPEAPPLKSDDHCGKPEAPPGWSKEGVGKGRGSEKGGGNHEKGKGRSK